MSEQENQPTVGRNEPCPCGSGKKYKRCHGIDAAPKLTQPKLDWSAPAGGVPGKMPDFSALGADNPMAGMDPQWMMQFTQALQRLPKGQMQRLQHIMQKAMSGTDVSREAEEFERTLPVEFQELMRGFKMPEGMMGAEAQKGLPGPAEAVRGGPAEMTAEEAAEIVAKAAAEGKISAEQAEALMPTQDELAQKEAEAAKGKGFSKLWRGITGK